VNASKEGARVNAHRKKYYDRIQIMLDKGGSAMLHTLALREGMNTSAYLRRAALDRAGLNVMPYDMSGLEDIHTAEDADAALKRLQHEEDTNPGIRKIIETAGPEADIKTFQVTIPAEEKLLLYATMQKITLAANNCGGGDIKTILTGKEIRAIRRALANMEEV